MEKVIVPLKRTLAKIGDVWLTSNIFQSDWQLSLWHPTMTKQYQIGQIKTGKNLDHPLFNFYCY